MKATTSDWFATLDLRSMKMLVCLLFDLDSKARESRYYDLFIGLRSHLDDEYHAAKQHPRGAIQTYWERLGS